ncbi:arylamine N-acetyltransferase [Bacillus sp. JJ664]
MSQLNTLFRKRIDFTESKNISFSDLEHILMKTAFNIPFENICIINKNTNEITKDNLIQKILLKNEGGLCYELNAILYLFLIENGFNARLVSGVVYDNVNSDYQNIGRTHVTILLSHEGQTYLIDTGFGANLPLKPVPLNGDMVISNNGEFRVKKEKTAFGDYILEIKLKHKDNDWRIGYAFDSERTINDLSDLNEIQTIIKEHEKSPFNKNPLITKLTNEGNVTLTNNSFTQWKNGTVLKEEIEKERFKQLMKNIFNHKGF